MISFYKHAIVNYEVEVGEKASSLPPNIGWVCILHIQIITEVLVENLQPSTCQLLPYFLSKT